MARNYSGPVYLSTAMSKTPHITPTDLRYFTVTPDSVVNDTTNYLQSLTFIPGVIFMLGFFIALGYWIWLCCMCECCGEFRASMRGGSRPARPDDTCCKQCCWRRVAKRAPAPRRQFDGDDDAAPRQGDEIAPIEPYGIALIVLGVSALTFAIVSLVYVARFGNEIYETVDEAGRIEDYQDATLVQLSVLSASAQIVNTSVTDLQPSVFESNISIQLKVGYAFVVEQSAAAVESTLNARSTADVDLQIRSNEDNARSYANYFVIACAGLLVLGVLLITVSSLVTFGPPKPEGISQGILDGINVFLFLAATLLVGGFFVYVGTAIGDVCQDPTAYLLEFINKEDGQSTPNTGYLDYYINCAPGTTNPNDADLQAAYGSTYSAREVVYAINVATTNGTDPYLFNQTDRIYLEQTLVLEQLNYTLERSTCERVHNIITDVETQTCHDMLPSGVIFMITFLIFWTLLIAVQCAMPRRNLPYTSIPDTATE